MTTDRHTLHHNRAGFTLIELMITLVVIGVAAALVAPAIMSMSPNMALKSAGRDLFANMQKAKVLAIRENTPAIVLINATSYSYFVDLDRDGAYTASVVDTFTDNNVDGMYNPGETFVDTDGNGIYSGETATTTIFNNYGDYGIALGTGKATANWDNNPCNQAATIVFTSRGTASTPGTVYIDNRNIDISYAASVLSAGAIKLRKYDGATPFAVAHWGQ